MFKVMISHRFGSTGDPLPRESCKMVELCRVSDRNLGERIVDKLRRQRFTDGDGRTRYRYGRRGVQLAEDHSQA